MVECFLVEVGRELELRVGQLVLLLLRGELGDELLRNAVV